MTKGLPQETSNFTELVQPWLDLGASMGGGFGAILVVLCLIAVKHHYQITFSFTKGFHFGPAPSADSKEHQENPPKLDPP